MVRFTFALLALALAGHCSAAQLTATLDVKESRLGEPVLLQLIARGKNVTLDQVDLAALETSFEVFSVTRSGDAKRARLETTLYPLHAGTLVVPAIDTAGGRSKPLTLSVSEDPDLVLSADFTPDSLFERQRSVLLITIRDKADRQWTTPTRLEAPGLLLRSLGERQFEEGVGAERANVRELRWEALGLKGQHHALKLPMLDGYQLGRRLRVPLPVAPLEVRALPSYLPVAVPVGKPGVSSELPARDGKVGRPLLWVLRISAPGFTSDAARALLRLPQGELAGLRFYPPSLTEEEASEQSARALRIEIPIIPTAAGVAQIPALKLPYFDPASLRLEQVDIEGAPIAISDPFWKKVGVAGTVVALLIAGGFALYAGRTLWQRRRARRAALERIARARTSGELVHALCVYSKAPHPLTLRQWLRRMAKLQNLKPMAEELERAHFGAQGTADLDAMKQQWLAALRRSALT